MSNIRHLVICALALAVASLVHAQGLTRGTRTAPAMTVAYVTKTSQLENAKNDVEAALPVLWAACHAANLHPLGVPTLSVEIGGVEAGMLKWEAWLPLVDKLDPERLPQTADFKIKQIPAAPVAYLYSAGDPYQTMQDAFTDLFTWALNQNLPTTGFARATIYLGPLGKEPQDIVTECQLVLRQ